MASPKKLQIGIMMETVQLSDIMGVDIIGNLSASYYAVVKQFFGDKFEHLAPEMEFHWIASTISPSFATPAMHIVPTKTYDDAPRDLDILFIGGPPPDFRPAAADKFMEEAFARTKNVLTTCIGSVWLASSGVMNGLKATTNREFLPMAKQLYPDVDWLDQRWVIDGKLWTSGGAGAGKSRFNFLR